MRCAAKPPRLRPWRRLSSALLALLCLLCGRDCLGWSAYGHRIASAAALSYLASAPARGLDSGETRVLEAMLAGEDLGDAAVWPDLMRDDPSDFWQRVAPPLHYVTVPPGRRYEDIGAPAKGDAVTGLVLFEHTLRDPDSSDAEAALALRFGLHIVQDLQQPLHAGIGSDRGGNDVTVAVLGEKSNFHRVWDYHIIAHRERSIRGWVRALRRRGLHAEATSADRSPQQWIAETVALRDTLYPPPRQVDARYLEAQLPAVERRLADAGRRSALWLRRAIALREQALRERNSR